MTGIERLREWADGYAELSKDHTTIDVVPSGMATLLSSIADQIERETKPKSDAVKYASVSAYDPPSQEDREAIAWVREHGGLDAVKRRWECLSYYADPVPRSCMEKRLARLQRQIDESHAALGRRREIISELNRRACDLTRENAERGETIRKLSDRAAKQSDEIRVMRDVIAETCARLGVEGTGSTVDDAQVIWREIARRLMPDGMEWLLEAWPMLDPYRLTHRGPVLAADGKPLEAGQTVYAKNYGYVKCTVLAIEWVVDGYLVEVENEGGHKFRQTPDEFTHERPVEDTWERIEDDAGCTATKYNERRGTTFTTKQQVARDLVRRCRALAERGK